MPIRIFAGVGDHPCFFTFITMILIGCKIINFSSYLFVHFFIGSAQNNNCQKSSLACTQLLAQNPLPYTLGIH